MVIFEQNFFSKPAVSYFWRSDTCATFHQKNDLEYSHFFSADTCPNGVLFSSREKETFCFVESFLSEAYTKDYKLVLCICMAAENINEFAALLANNSVEDFHPLTF